ncbi:MAG: hypothetical protein ACT4PJ_12580 [Gemmatimonadaceae bacterium]
MAVRLSAVEADYARVLSLEGLDVPRELRPALEVVHARDHELRVGQHEPLFPDLRVGEPAKARVTPPNAVEDLTIARLERFYEVLRLLPGLLQVDARGERSDGHDDDLLSRKRLESARIRLKEDRVVSSQQWVGTALSADWRRPSRSP